MKKIILLAFALILAFSLAACDGGTDSPGGNDGNDTPDALQDGGDAPGGNDNNGVLDGNDETPNGNNDNNNAAGFINIFGDPLNIPETALSFEDAVGVSVEGKRIVRKYTDKFLDIVYTPDGCTVVYQIYEFDAETGELSDSQLWYGGFTDSALFSNAFQKTLDQTYENHIRGYNVGNGYYGYYTWPAIQDANNDGAVTWDDAVAGGEYESDDNHILIN